MKVLILAGGFATRLWPITEKRAKPLLPIAGKPLITHLMEKIPRGLDVTVSTNAAFASEFHKWKEDLGWADVHIAVEGTHDDDRKLGALGALAAWVSQNGITEDILLLTGDNYLGFSLEEFLSYFKVGVPLIAAHDIGDKERAKAFGTILTENKENSAGAYRIENITGFEEKPANPKSTLISTGCAILPAATIPILLEYAKKKPDNVGGIFEELLRRGIGLRAFIFSEPWLDIGSFPSYLEAHKLIVGENTLIDPDASVQGTTFKGSNCVAQGCSIVSCELTDCIIFENCMIQNCSLRNCIIDKDCELQGVDLANKMLRAQTTLIVEED